MTKDQLKIKKEQEEIIKQSLLKMAKLPSVKKLQKIIDDAEVAIKILKKECKHENAKVEYGANTGNYDPTSDCYWIVANCKDCGFYGNFDSHDEPAQYRKWSLHKMAQASTSEQITINMPTYYTQLELIRMHAEKCKQEAIQTQKPVWSYTQVQPISSQK